MKWILQEMLHRNENVLRMARALEQEKIDFLWVRIEEDDSLTVISKEEKMPVEQSESILRDFTKNEKITIYGSKALALIAERKGWKPGSFSNDKFEFSCFKEALGDELLNADFQVGELWDLEPYEIDFFVRPTGNTKLFNGFVVKPDEFREWQRRESRKTSAYRGQPILISPLQSIQSEYRFFVVSGCVMTGSSYRADGKLNVTKKPHEGLWNYAQRMVEKFPLAEAFVIDIAETEKGFKVVEYNNFNTSGLYGCSEIELVKSIEKMDKPKR